MPHITTCSRCGHAYEESSEELAHAQLRECPACYQKRSMRPPPTCPSHGPMQKERPLVPQGEWLSEWWRCESCACAVLRTSSGLHADITIISRAKGEKNALV